MRRSNISSLSVIALAVVALAFVFGYLRVEAQSPVGSGFTYQGRMFDASNAPVQGTCDLALRLYDHDSGGAHIGATVTFTSVAMMDGYFDVTPDFGAPSFNGEARWLEIEAACPPGAGSTTFPRQAINVVPYALYALNSSAITSTVYVTSTVYYTPSYHLQGWETITGTPTTLNGYGITDVLKTGNGILTLLSASGLTLTAERDGAVIVRTGIPNIVGDSTGNARGVGAVDLQFGRQSDNQVASGEFATIGGGYYNRAYDQWATIGGGGGNQAGGVATVGGGGGNEALGYYSTVGGGNLNVAYGNFSTVVGGQSNQATGENSVSSGFNAVGTHNGVFLFADNTMDAFNSVVANEFAIRARGGFRHSWDNSNYWTAQVSNAGAVTFDATGTSSGFSFSDNVTAPNPLNIGTKTLTLTGSLTVPADGTSALLESANAFTADNTIANGKFLTALTDGGTGGLRAGASSDVLLYRGAADMWRTPDSLIVDNKVSIGTTEQYATLNLRNDNNGGEGAQLFIQNDGIYDGSATAIYMGRGGGALTANFRIKQIGYPFGIWGSDLSFDERTGASDWISRLFIQRTYGKVGIGTATPNTFTLQVAGNVGPNISNTYDLGSADAYWATIHYHTLSAHSLSVFSTTVTLQDGREVSCLDALKEIKADPSKKIKGIPHMDYATIPAIALNAATIIGFDRSTMTVEKDGEDGADLDMMVSLVLCAERELDAENTALDNRMLDLEKRIADLEQKVK
jgi:hypothetical protein